MYIAVCDDQKSELDELTALLRYWQENRRASMRCKLFSSAVDLLDAAQRERFTLYLMDIMMPGVDGMTAAREIRSFDDTAEIVFLTSSPGFAYESYGVHALNYLLKPVDTQVLFHMLDQLYLKEQKPQDALNIKNGTMFIRIPFSHIAYVEVNNKHLYFNLTDGQVREVTGSLNEYEPLLLSRPEFMKVHRSYIINMLQIEELSSSGIRTFSGKKLPVSRLIFTQLQKNYLKLLFDRREAAEP